MPQVYAINIQMKFTDETLRDNWATELISAYQTIKQTYTVPDSGALNKVDRYEPKTVSNELT